MFFGNFFDEDKTDAENDHESKKARHNRDVILCLTAVVTLVSVVAINGYKLKKMVDEVV